MNIYRIKLFTAKSGFHAEENHREYCFNNHTAAIGYPVEADNIDDYKKKCFIKYGNMRGFKISYNNICKINENDLIWTQKDGRTYLLGKVKGDIYIDKNEYGIGPSRQVYKWKEINFDDVPGKVISSFVGIGATLQCMNVDDSFKEYCNRLYEDKKIKLNQKSFNWKSLLHPDDLEDLLGLYLQEKGFYIIPSTNKQGTKLIEYELINKNGKRACVQCKVGNAKVESTIFNEFKDYHKIFIATVRDDSYNNQGENVETIKMEKLYKWASENKIILPKRIKNYMFPD